MSVQLYLGDCLEVMKSMPDKSVDTVITDPPYGLRFMGKEWDTFRQDKRGKNQIINMGNGMKQLNHIELVEFQEWTTQWAQAVYRVLKPGGLLLAFGGTRTYHRMVCAIEDAGFEIRDTIAWVYGSGFPKSYDISKGMDKYDATEARRNRDLRFTAWMRSTGLTASEINEITNSFMGSHYLTDKEQPAVATADMFDKLRPHVGYVPQWVEKIVEERTIESENFKNREVVGETRKGAQQDSTGRYGAWGEGITPTAPSTPEAQLWHGWGTALKPAFEPIVVAMKPVDGTFVNNALTWGVAGLWIDGGRVGTEGARNNGNSHGTVGSNSIGVYGKAIKQDYHKGRFPANLIHDGSDEVLEVFPETKSGVAVRHNIGVSSRGIYSPGKDGAEGDNMQDLGYGDSGSAARFFYCAKASRNERNAGLELNKQNHHPTVKPISLMRYLVRLTKTPTGGVVLDPFMGSGTTGCACALEGREFIGIEREQEYIEIAEKRIAYWSLQPGLEVE